MAGVLLDMAQVVLGWGIAFVAIAGWGHWVHRLCGSFTLKLELWLEHFWLGLVAVLAFLQIWNLFLPVDWRAGLVVALIGAGATVSHPPRLALSRSHLLTLLLCAPLLLRLAHQSLLPPSHFDSGLYHFNVVRWHMEYALPPGLGNLHGRLAFNISYFLYVAMLNVHPWFQHGHNIATSLWLAVLIVQLGLWIRRLLVQADPLNAPSMLRLCLLPVVAGTAGLSPISGMTYHTLASPSPENPLFIWGIVLFLKFVDYLLPPQSPSDDHYSPLVICSMAVSAITLKLSMAVFAAAIIAITAAVWFWRAESRRNVARRISLALLALTLLILAPWSARSVIMTGYPCYPSTVGAVRADWKVPTEKVTEMSRIISNWAKGGLVRLRPNWLQHWAENYLGRPILSWPLIMLGISSVALLVLRMRVPFDRKLLLPLLPPLLSVLYWFLVAPNVRFAGSALWLLALWPAALALTLVAQRIQFPARWRFIVGLLAVAIAISWKPLFRKSPHFRGNLDGFAPTPTVPLTLYRTRSGLEVWVPVNDQRTWDAPLPAAPRWPAGTPEGLELRGPSLRNGFRVRAEDSAP